MMKSPWDGLISRAARRRPGGSGMSRRLALCGLILLGGAACSLDPPSGEPIDYESLPQFKPFELRNLDGEPRVLADFLDRLTLVSFFFPT
jgi:cytochrome oxidase Cu insertion factor (SCO1/SenC/PrrC family)